MLVFVGVPLLVAGRQVQRTPARPGTAGFRFRTRGETSEVTFSDARFPVVLCGAAAALVREHPEGF